MSQPPRFSQLQSRLVPLPSNDVDTDQIIPASFLKTTTREGLAAGLFAHWRQDPEFVLNQHQHQGSQVLLAGENFGCGSSREHAPWALLDHGFRAVISPRFADIFRSNSLKNGLLPIETDKTTWQRLQAAVAAKPAIEVSIDLESCLWHLPGGEPVAFEVDPFARRCLLDGVDQLGYLLRQQKALEAYEASHPPTFDSRQIGSAG